MSSGVGVKVKAINELASGAKTMTFCQIVAELSDVNDDLNALGYADAWTFSRRALEKLGTRDHDAKEACAIVPDPNRPRLDHNALVTQLCKLQDELLAHGLDEVAGLIHRAIGRMTLKAMPEEIQRRMEAKKKSLAS